MNKEQRKYELFARLQSLGFTYEEAVSLRRIEMTLHRWAELECGDGNDYASWSIERREDVAIELINWPDANGTVWLVEKRDSGYFPLRDLKTNNPKEGRCLRALAAEKAAIGKPFLVTYPHNGPVRRRRIADREKGALKRLAAIIKARNLRESPSEFMQANAQDWVVSYHQTDPRGCALYLITRANLADSPIDQIYTRGLAVAA